MEFVLGFCDSFISCYRDDMALFKMEAHFPFVCPFIECVKSSWSAAAFILGLRAIDIMVSSATSLTVDVMLSGMSLM